MDDPSGMKQPAVAVDEYMAMTNLDARPLGEPDDVPIMGLGNE